jgi:hypothetical protein
MHMGVHAVKSIPDVTAEMKLADRLSQCPTFTAHDEGHHREAPTLAHGLADVEEACSAFLDHLPRLVAATDCDAIQESFSEIYVDLTHLIYQLWAAKSFRTLLGCKPEWISS